MILDNIVAFLGINIFVLVIWYIYFFLMKSNLIWYSLALLCCSFVPRDLNFEEIFFQYLPFHLSKAIIIQFLHINFLFSNFLFVVIIIITTKFRNFYWWVLIYNLSQKSWLMEKCGFNHLTKYFNTSLMRRPSLSIKDGVQHVEFLTLDEKHRVETRFELRISKKKKRFELETIFFDILINY